jgi:hypothetical protein
MSCDLLPGRVLLARFRAMIYDFDSVYEVALGHDIELLHERDLFQSLEHLQLVLAAERAVLAIVRALHLALEEFVEPALVFWVLHVRKVGVPVDALVGGCKSDVAIKFPEDDVKTLHKQALCVVLIDD